MASSAEVAALLQQKEELADAAKAAKAAGRPIEWYASRPDTQRYVGLANQGATCYLNSLLQGLYICPEVRHALYAFKYDPALHGEATSCVPLQLCKLFTQLQHSSRRAHSTRALTSSFGWSAAESFRQHDAQELCRVLFEALSKFGVPCERDVAGEMRDVLRCLECGYESVRTEAFSDVQLDVVGCASVEQALRGMASWERMEGEDSWRCSSCSARRSAKAAHFTALPPLLMLQLKRFVFDLQAMDRPAHIPRRASCAHLRHRHRHSACTCVAPQQLACGHAPGLTPRSAAAPPSRQAMDRRKLNHRVAFPMELDMAPYLGLPPLDDAASETGPGGAGDGGGDGDGGRDGGGDGGGGGGGGGVRGGSEHVYECIGALVHSGSAHGGHYFALLRPPGGEAGGGAEGTSGGAEGTSGGVEGTSGGAAGGGGGEAGGTAEGAHGTSGAEGEGGETSGEAADAAAHAAALPGWYEFNDAVVRPATAAALAAAAGRGEPDSSRYDSGSSSYMLLYRRKGLGAHEGEGEAAGSGDQDGEGEGGGGRLTPPRSVLEEVQQEEAEAARLRAIKASVDRLAEARELARISLGWPSPARAPVLAGPACVLRCSPPRPPPPPAEARGAASPPPRPPPCRRAGASHRRARHLRRMPADAPRRDQRCRAARARRARAAAAAALRRGRAPRRAASDARARRGGRGAAAALAPLARAVGAP